jgi:hypothetical protein
MARPYPLDPGAITTLNARRRALGWSMNTLGLRCQPPVSDAALAKYFTLRCGVAPEVLQRMEQALADGEASGGSTSTQAATRRRVAS